MAKYQCGILAKLQDRSCSADLYSLKSFSISVVVSPPLCTDKFLPAIMLSSDSRGHALLGAFCCLFQVTDKRPGYPVLLKQQSLLLSLSPDHSSSQPGQLMSHLPIRGSFLGCGRPFSGLVMAGTWYHTLGEGLSSYVLRMPLMWGFFSLSCH